MGFAPLAKKRLRGATFKKGFAPLAKKRLRGATFKKGFAPLAKKRLRGATLKRDLHHSPKKGSVAQLNSALDFGSSGYRFESYRSHKRHPLHEMKWVFLYYCVSKTRFCKQRIIKKPSY